MRRVNWLFAVALFWLLSGCSLAADVTPPPDYESQRIQQMTAQAPTFPLTMPDSQVGQQIYQSYCAGCHGEQGLGDGPRAGLLAVRPPSFQDPLVYGGASPLEWYQVLYSGRNEMPGFGGVLSSSDQWDVIAYLYRLGFGTQTLQQGQSVYEQRCQSCHGVQGAGDGPTAARLPGHLPDWRDMQVLGRFAVEDLLQMAQSVNMPDGSPHAAGLLPEDLQAAVIYVRWLSFDRQARQVLSAQVTPSAIGTATAVPTGAAIGGSVINLTTGLPQQGLPVALLRYDRRSEQPVYAGETKTDADGMYRFENLPNHETYTYVVQTSFQGVLYFSAPVETRELMTDVLVNRPVETYDASDDISALQVSRLHIFLDFSKEDTLQVVEMFSITNPANQTVRARSSGQPVLQFVLPQEATNLRFDPNTSLERYMTTPNGFGVLDAVLPGPGYQVLFSYELPYDGKKNLSLSMPLAVVSALVMVPEGVMQVEGPLTSLGKQTIQEQSFNIYQATNLKQQSILELQISGKMKRRVQFNVGSTLGFGLELLGIALVGVALVVSYSQWRKRLQKKQQSRLALTQNTSQDEILDAIIALDDAYQAGQIGEAAYMQRRTALKEQLRGLNGRD